MKKFWHRLTPLLVETLVQFRNKVVEKNENKIHLQHDLYLSKNEYNNFQKLRYHALVAKYKEHGEHIPGYWVITKRGAEFLNGIIQVPVRVATFRNKVVAKSEEMVSAKQILEDDPYLVFDIEAKDPTEEEIDEILIIRKKKKRKGKSYCPRCEEQLKVKIEDTLNEDGGMTVIRTLVCPKCNYEMFS